eukprot:2522119-Amphidinium_carterae.1
MQAFSPYCTARHVIPGTYICEGHVESHDQNSCSVGVELDNLITSSRFTYRCFASHVLDVCHFDRNNTICGNKAPPKSPAFLTRFIAATCSITLWDHVGTFSFERMQFPIVAHFALFVILSSCGHQKFCSVDGEEYDGSDGMS